MSLGSSSSWQQHFCCSDSSEELKSSWAQELLIKAEASGAFLRSQPEKGRGKHHHNLTIKKRQRHHQRLPKTHYTLLLPPSCSSFLLSRGCAVLPKAGGAFISRSSFWSSSPHLSGLRPFFSLGLCSGSSCSPPEQHSPAQAQLHSQGPFYRVRGFVFFWPKPCCHHHLRKLRSVSSVVQPQPPLTGTLLGPSTAWIQTWTFQV